MHWPSLMLHSRMVPSAEAVNRRSPYILNTRIRAEWPSNTFTLAHVSAPATTTITTTITTTTTTTKSGGGVAWREQVQFAGLEGDHLEAVVGEARLLRVDAEEVVALDLKGREGRLHVHDLYALALLGVPHPHRLVARRRIEEPVVGATAVHPRRVALERLQTLAQLHTTAHHRTRTHTRTHHQRPAVMGGDTCGRYDVPWGSRT